MRFPIGIAVIGFIGVTCLASPSFAQTDAALTCTDLQMPITGVRDDDTFSFTIPVDDLTAQCTASNDAILTVVSPTEDVTVTPAPHSSQTIPFTVSDGKGHTATANVIVTRD